METKHVVIGLLIFAFVTISIFLIASYALHINDSASVIGAIIFGGVAEFIYRKRQKRMS